MFWQHFITFSYKIMSRVAFISLRVIWQERKYNLPFISHKRWLNWIVRRRAWWPVIWGYATVVINKTIIIMLFIINIINKHDLFSSKLYHHYDHYNNVFAIIIITFIYWYSFYSFSKHIMTTLNIISFLNKEMKFFQLFT